MKGILNKIVSAAKSIMFLLLNSIEYLLTPEIDELSDGELKVIAFDNEYLGDVIDLWRTTGFFSITYKFLLRLCGNRLCFILVNRNKKFLGFICFYYRFEDIKSRRIHAAVACLDINLKRKGYGRFLYKSAFDSFRKSRWIRGISAKYTVSNEPPRRILMKYGFNVVNRYFDKIEGEEREYAVYDFNA
jgi:ribosomal protein S18 acetylase RimI-like enzyme